MKGMSEFIVVVVFCGICVLAILGMYIFVIYSNLPGGPGSTYYQVRFAESNIKPYLISEVLTHYQVGDKQLIERSIESIAVDELDNEINFTIRNLTEVSYEIDSKNYYVTLEDSENLFVIKKQEKKDFFKAVIPILYRDEIGYMTVATG